MPRLPNVNLAPYDSLVGIASRMGSNVVLTMLLDIADYEAAHGRSTKILP